MQCKKATSDAYAIRNVLAGRQEDYSILVNRYLSAMETIAYSATGSYPDAEDIAQESLLQAYRYLDRLKEPNSFRAWLTTIVKNMSRKFLTQRAKQGALKAFLPEKTVQEISLEQREVHAFLRQELGKMDEIYRDVLLLHYFNGMTAKEIGEHCCPKYIRSSGSLHIR